MRWLRSSPDCPFDRTSPLIPIGPHWMLMWPFTAEHTGLSTVISDAGTMIMFAGTPYAHLHICGDTVGRATNISPTSRRCPVTLTYKS